MAEKPALFAPISEQDQWHVSAYLIAIAPRLQKSAKSKKQEEQASLPRDADRQSGGAESKVRE